MSKNLFAVIIYVSCGLSMESRGVLRFSGILLILSYLFLWNQWGPVMCTYCRSCGDIPYFAYAFSHCEIYVLPVHFAVWK